MTWRAPGAALAGIITVTAVLRFSLLGQNSLWFDEAWMAWIGQQRWQDIVPLLRAGDAHPPLSYFLMKAWIGIAGDGEAALRFLSACCGVLSVALTYALARRISTERVSLLSALVIGVSPFAVMAGQEVRMYALLGTLALASTLALVASVVTGPISALNPLGITVRESNVKSISIQGSDPNAQDSIVICDSGAFAPASVSCTAVIGVITTSSWSCAPLLPFGVSTPTTWKSMPLNCTVAPSGSCDPNRFVTTVWPSSATRLRFVTSSAPNAVPSATV